AGLMCVVMLFVIGAIWRRWAAASGAGALFLIVLQSSDRRVLIDFTDEHVRLETEFFRGEGAWTELEEVVVFPGFWTLYLSNGGQVILPRAVVSAALEEFIRAKAQMVTAPVRVR